MWSLVALLASADLPAARPCRPDEIAAITAPTDEPYSLTCQARLSAGQTIQRRIVLRSTAASGASLDCAGSSVGRADRNVTTATPTVAVWSSKQAGGQWSAPTDIRIRNCRILGSVRIWGMGSDGHYDDLRLSSRESGHTARLQALAPTRIHLENLTITGMGSIPLYIGPGATAVTLQNSTLNGTTTATAIYLDAESGSNRILNNRILTRTGREMVAVDGSASNTITGNRFDLHGQAGITLYRNCGERGVIRHQTPSNNRIENNSFTGASWLRPRLVVENARNGRRSYCDDDAGYAFGSSVDDRDNAGGNAIRNNRRQ